MEGPDYASFCYMGKQMQYSFPGGISDTFGIIKHLKAVGMVIYITSLLKLSMCPVQETDNTWRRTEEYHKLNHIVTSFTDHILDGIFLLDQINFVCGFWSTVTDQAFPPPLYLLIKTNQKQLNNKRKSTSQSSEEIAFQAETS